VADITEQEDDDNDNTRRQLIHSRFNHSAAVAMGMLLEEVLTATLMPLAERHVMRCRELEGAIPDQNDDGENNVVNPKARPKRSKSTPDDCDTARAILQARQHVFEQWTLPPEQAIVQLVVEAHLHQQGIQQYRGLATTSPPAKSAVPGAVGTSLLKTCPKQDNVKPWPLLLGAEITG